MKLPSFLRNWYASFSYLGLAIAALFFAGSLTPSLLPRHFAVQGVLSGISLAVGYGVGVLFIWVWNYLELAVPGSKVQRIGKPVTAVAVLLTAGIFLWRATVWQNSIRELMEMAPVATAYPWRIALIACLTAVILIAMTRGLLWCCEVVHRLVNRFVPRRISYVVSAVIVGLLVALAVNHLLVETALDIADATFLQIDKIIDDDVNQPMESLVCGSPDSTVDWETIGRRGKQFIVTGPTQKQIGEFWGEAALPPLRVYVGLRTRETLEERARLALEELIRVGGFQRSVLVVATPTGTGWLDPGGVDTLEYLHKGDTAIVGVQYSSLPSWITITIDPERSRDTARILFDEIYGYWKTLPKDARPKFYLFGLSLGSLGSESSADLFTVFEDPIQGGVWSGPPSPSPIWSRAMSHRNPDSPAWLPKFRDGTMVRFTGRKCTLEESGNRWGPMRFVFIQHASDPMTFCSPDLLYRKPAWLNGQRGPDVSSYLRWYPIVTFLQTAFDLPMATSVPIGYGHNYDPASYLDAWIQVTEPKAWDAERTRRLKEVFAQ